MKISLTSLFCSSKKSRKIFFCKRTTLLQHFILWIGLFFTIYWINTEWYKYLSYFYLCCHHEKYANLLLFIGKAMGKYYSFCNKGPIAKNLFPTNKGQPPLFWDFFSHLLKFLWKKKSQNLLKFFLPYKKISTPSLLEKFLNMPL